MAITDKDVQKLKKAFATKEDLEKFATKKDLKQFATKKDLEKFETKKDADKSRQKLKTELRDEMHVMFEKQREQVREDNEELFFKYKSELITQIDPILKEVSASREERAVTSQQIERNSDRIDKIEKHLDIANTL